MNRLSIAYKLGIGAVLLVLTSAGLVGGLFYNKTTQLLVENSAQNIAYDINNAAGRLQKDIDTQKADTLFLSDTPPIQGMLRALAKNNFNYDEQGDSTYAQWKSRLKSIFINLLKSKSVYLKLRFIDKTGQEIVVVRRKENTITSINRIKLQNKRHRRYVKDTIKLKKGEIYLSEVNLNREHGKVSIPHQQVLRSASPIYNKTDGKLAGLIIITAEIGHTFQEIQHTAQNETSKIYITNDRGGYLLNPDHSKNYGFDLGKRYRIQEDFPELAPMYLPDSRDTKFIRLPKKADDKYVLNFTKIPFDKNNPNRFIAVGISEQYSTILNKQKNVLTEIVMTSIILAFGVMLLAILFAYRLSQPIKQIIQVMDDYTQKRKSKIKMPTERGDEIGQLAKSYEVLINKVADGQQKLEDLNQNLSKMVTDRTIELKQSEAYQRAIVMSMAEGLVITDNRGTILSINAAAESIFGYSQNEIVDKNVGVLMPAPEREEHDHHIDKYHITGDKHLINKRRELEGQRKNGAIFPIELAISEVIVSDKQIFTGVIRDITEQKQIDRMKNEFVSNVSHELRTPLTAIKGSLGLIAGGALGELPEKAAEMVQLANNNTNRLLLLINDILDIQKIESGEMVFNFELIDTTSFLNEVLEENEAYGAQYDIRYFLAEGSNDIKIYADKYRMMQVLANLLSNAAKFSPKGSSVEIEVTQDNAQSVLISVKDNGEGIPLAFQPRLFDKFTQSDSASTRQTGSSGLGLNISKMIVETHGGTLTFVSQEGEGSIFTATLPNADESQKKREKS